MGCVQARRPPRSEPPDACGPGAPPAQVPRYDKSGIFWKVDGAFWTTDRHATMPPRVAEDEFSPAGHPPVTLDAIFEGAAARGGEREALRVERLPDGAAPTGSHAGEVAWKVWTWRGYFAESCRAARGLRALGLGDKGAVCIYGFNAPEWFMAQQAACIANGAFLGIYPSDGDVTVQYKARHGGASVAVVEGPKQIAVFRRAALEVADGLPELRAVVVWLPGAERDAIRRGERDWRAEGGGIVRVLTWQQLVDEEADAFSEEQLAAVRSRVAPGTLAGYIYTSGTTGRPKAVMVSHDNVAYECFCMRVVAPDLGAAGEERSISYLPLSHVAGMLIDIAVPMYLTYQGPGWATTSFARPTDLKEMTLANRIKAVQPTVFLGVPRVWEKIMERMAEMKALAISSGEMDQRAQDRSRDAARRGREWAVNMQLGGSGERPGNCIERYVDGKVYQIVRERLGLACCKFAMTGAAPMPLHVQMYFGQLGINVNELYGMSECCGATTGSNDDAHVWGSCGFAFPGAEVAVFEEDRSGGDPCGAERAKRRAELYPGSFARLVRDAAASPPVPSEPIAEEYQGELCFRGRHVMMGYMANPDLGTEHVAEMRRKNAEVVDSEGWLHSGDKAAMDRDGLVRITGRFKEIIIPSGGENVAPVPVEDAIKADARVSPLLSNVMLVGDRRKYCVAVVSLKVAGATGDDAGDPSGTLQRAAQDAVRGFGGGAVTVGDAADDPRVVDEIAAAIARVNKDPGACPGSVAQVKSFTIIPVDFSVAGGQLTATLKARRAVIEAEHACMVGVRETGGETGMLYAAAAAGRRRAAGGTGVAYARYDPGFGQ